jgi:seryl-tRNA synthetase
MSDTTETEYGSALPLPTAAPGVLLFPEAFERIVAGLRRGIDALAADEPARVLGIPPVIARSTIERTGYPASFPHLLGTVHRFTGDAAQWSALSPLVEAGGEWQSTHEPSDLVLLPAACYPVYASLAGQQLDEPRTYHVSANCFRQEATSETGRLRSFRMVELVTAGDPEHCEQWRDRRLEQAADWLGSLELKVAVESADDPFFGSGRRVYQAAQRMQRLKFELRAAVDEGLVQAIGSANWHKDHFGGAFGFTADGAPAHTACVGFGLERIALALIHAHGPVPARWPARLAAALG